ncbi:pyridoxamine 5'-phosphate oxidase family protein [bacterium]|nr:pyridoxamine 5'-phosphate oxidase family protein [bacterium]
MGQRYPHMNDKHIAFVQAQKIFFVATAAPEGRVNLSPKGMDTLRVLSPDRVAWLNVTGSGNETAAHVRMNPRMTIMFCAFEGPPMILRLYGSARAIHRADPEWNEMIGLFPEIPGARQIFEMQVDLVQTSCGMGVPYFEFARERTALNDTVRKWGEEKLNQYWQEKNRQSIDGFETGIVIDHG